MIRNCNSRRILGRKMGLASAAAWRPSEPDADTLLRRALHDARGKTVRHGVTYKDGKEVKWSIVRSVRGRTNQLDVLVNGLVWATGGTRKLRTKGIPI